MKKNTENKTLHNSEQQSPSSRQTRSQIAPKKVNLQTHTDTSLTKQNATHTSRDNSHNISKNSQFGWK